MKNEEKAKYDFDERVKSAKIDAIENNKIYLLKKQATNHWKELWCE